MKIKLFLIIFFISSFIKAQNLARYTFAAVTQSTGIIDPTPTPTVIGLTCGSFSAAGTTTANANSTNSSRFSFTRWPLGATTGVDTYSTMTGSLDQSKYYEVTLTPTSNYTVEITSILLTVQRTAAGVRNYAVRSSIDNFASNLPASVTTNTNLSVVANNVFFFNYDSSPTYTNVTNAQSGSTVTLTNSFHNTPITFRFYGWNSETNAGTFSLNDVTFKGTMIEPCHSPSVTLITNNLPVCSNDTLRLLPTVLGTPSFTYAWKGSGTFNSRTTKNATIRNPKTGTYTLIATNACGVDTATTAVTINPTPTISVSSASICLGNSVSLNCTGATSYTWSSGELSSAISVSPSVTTTYTVSGTNTLNCENFKTVTVTVNPLPTLSITASTDKICWGHLATLTAEGASTYTWSTNEIASSVTVSPSFSSTFTVTGTNSNNCESQSFISITVYTVPILAVTANADKICWGNSAILTAEGASTYTWSTNETVSSVTVSPTSSVTYTVVGTNSNNCENQTTITLTVVPMPTLSVTANEDKICWGNSTTLTAQGASTYTWSTNEVSSSVTVTPTTTTTFTVSGTNSDICESQATVTVTVHPLPTLSVTASVDKICFGNSATLTAEGASTYTWSTNEIASSVTVSPTSSTTYSVTGTNSDNCENRATVTLTVNDLPNVSLDLTSIHTQCSNTQSVVLSGGTPLGGTYSGNHTNLNVFYPSNAGMGTFTVTYTYTDNNQCSKAIASEIEVSACTGITSFDEAFIQLYPNPNKGYIFIKSPVYIAFVEILDVLGKKVHSQDVEYSELIIDASSLENGVYTLRIKTMNQIFTQKVIIDK